MSILLNNKIEENKSKEQNEVIMIQDCGEGTSNQNWSSQLKQIFPDTLMKELESMSSQSTPLDETAEIMLNRISSEV